MVKADEKEKQTITKDDVGSLEVVLAEPVKLPELIGGFITKVMKNPSNLNQCSHELQMWHNSQPLEDRKELVRATRKSIETAKLTAEWLFSQYQIISQKDA